jgi:hypothetical protein
VAVAAPLDGVGERPTEFNKVSEDTKRAVELTLIDRTGVAVGVSIGVAVATLLDRVGERLGVRERLGVGERIGVLERDSEGLGVRERLGVSEQLLSGVTETQTCSINTSAQYLFEILNDQ